MGLSALHCIRLLIHDTVSLVAELVQARSFVTSACTSKHCTLDQPWAIFIMAGTAYGVWRLCEDAHRTTPSSYVRHGTRIQNSFRGLRPLQVPRDIFDQAQEFRVQRAAAYANKQ
jgi:hypothetical protein